MIAAVPKKIRDLGADQTLATLYVGNWVIA